MAGEIGALLMLYSYSIVTVSIFMELWILVPRRGIEPGSPDDKQKSFKKVAGKNKSHYSCYIVILTLKMVPQNNSKIYQTFLGNFGVLLLILFTFQRQEGPHPFIVKFFFFKQLRPWMILEKPVLFRTWATESWSLAELPNWLAKLSHTDLLSDSWSK